MIRFIVVLRDSHWGETLCRAGVVHVFRVRVGVRATTSRAGGLAPLGDHENSPKYVDQSRSHRSVAPVAGDTVILARFQTSVLHAMITSKRSVLHVWS